MKKFDAHQKQGTTTTTTIKCPPFKNVFNQSKNYIKLVESSLRIRWWRSNKGTGIVIHIKDDEWEKVKEKLATTCHHLYSNFVSQYSKNQHHIKHTTAAATAAHIKNDQLNSGWWDEPITTPKFCVQIVFFVAPSDECWWQMRNQHIITLNCIISSGRVRDN